jgi:SAM-dependent methyltransferase
MTSKPVSMPRRTTAEVSWQRAAGGMDTTLPATSPVTEAVIGHTPDLAAGSLFLDLACGTGQPTFALAAARPAAEVLGIDVTPAMVEQARAKAASNAVANVRFEVTSVDRLPCRTRASTLPCHSSASCRKEMSPRQCASSPGSWPPGLDTTGSGRPLTCGNCYYR